MDLKDSKISFEVQKLTFEGKQMTFEVQELIFQGCFEAQMTFKNILEYSRIIPA